VMSDGQKNRSTAATKMNTESSRSHLLLQLRVSVTNAVTKKVRRSAHRNITHNFVPWLTLQPISLMDHIH
jgi:hypothetical protein